MDPKDFLSSSTRRGFLSRTARAGVGLSAAAVLRDLHLIGTASAQGTLTDYKALCCIFLAGGNDSDNTIIDIGNYGNYYGIRKSLAIAQNKLLSIAQANGPTYGLHPSLGGIKQLFDEKKAAVVFNVGPLLAPLTKAQYRNGTVAVPPQLFSHSDQALHWQTSLPDQPPATGWAGRMAELMLDGIPTLNAGKVFLNTSLAGTNTFQTGRNLNQYNISTKGAVTLQTKPAAAEWTGGWHQTLQNVADINTANSNLQRSAYAGVLSNAKATGADLNTALAPTGDGSTWALNNPFPDTSLGNQLKMVARMIEARGRLGMQRQTFFTQVGGYDTHADQVVASASEQGTHAKLLTDLSAAVLAFQRAMEWLNIADKVVSFTASDFGRTFRSNGLGSDHGWGGHHFVIGGTGGLTSAVKGGLTYGALPGQDLSIDPLTGDSRSPDDAGAGRWIPKISVDEYSATLAKWFGVSNPDLDTVFPNLGRFVQRDVGFLNP